MSAKNIISLVLIVFVLVSVVYLVAKETGNTSQSANSGETVEQQSTTPGQQVIAYYCHGHVRCATCRKFEAYTTEAIESRFPDELKSGDLEWRIVNVEDPGNEHFVQDFQLTTRSVVLVKQQDGKQVFWKNLDKIWDVVGEKDIFVAYIQTEIKTLLEHKS